MTTIILTITIIVALCLWAGHELAQAMALTGCEDGVVPVGAIVMNAEAQDLGMPIRATRHTWGWSVDADDPYTMAVLAEMEALYGYDPMLPEAAWAAMEDMACASVGQA